MGQRVKLVPKGKTEPVFEVDLIWEDGVTYAARLAEDVQENSFLKSDWEIIKPKVWDNPVPGKIIQYDNGTDEYVYFYVNDNTGWIGLGMYNAGAGFDESDFESFFLSPEKWRVLNEGVFN